MTPEREALVAIRNLLSEHFRAHPESGSPLLGRIEDIASDALIEHSREWLDYIERLSHDVGATPPTRIVTALRVDHPSLTERPGGA